MDNFLNMSTAEISPIVENEDFWVAEARRNPRAFAHLYDAYVQPVYRYLLSKTGKPQEAEDLTAQTFLAALQGLPRYRHRGQFAAWLFSIARNKAADYYRHRKEEQTLEEIENRIVDTGWMQGVVKTERELDLSAIIQQLPEKEQELLRLRFVAQMRFREMATLLGKKEDTVKKMVYRLLARLERQMEDYRE